MACIWRQTLQIGRSWGIPLWFSFPGNSRQWQRMEQSWQLTTFFPKTRYAITFKERILNCRNNTSRSLLTSFHHMRITGQCVRVGVQTATQNRLFQS
jgi:hypothetical protein